MSLEANNGAPVSVGSLFRDLPKLIWAVVLFIGGVAYVAMKARRHQSGERTAQTTNVAAQKKR